MVTGLARACIDRGHAVQVLLPFYESLPDDQIGGLQHAHDFDCPKACRFLMTQLDMRKDRQVTSTSQLRGTTSQLLSTTLLAGQSMGRCLSDRRPSHPGLQGND